MAMRYRETLKRVTGGGAKVRFDVYMGQVDGAAPLDDSGEPITEAPRQAVLERFYNLFLGDPKDREPPEVNAGSKQEPVIEKSMIDNEPPPQWDIYWSFRKCGCIRKWRVIIGDDRLVQMAA